MALRLSFATGALAGIHIVTAAKTVRLGRAPAQNDILLTTPKVSRRHAVLERSARGGYSMEVIGSGPSRLNGDAIQVVPGQPTTTPLSGGDRVDLGSRHRDRRFQIGGIRFFLRGVVEVGCIR